MAIQPDFDPATLESLLGEPVALAPVTSGQSNPTWFVSTATRELVLRKKPAGVTASSAHAVDREHRVMSALSNSAVPVPDMVMFEPDPAVIGTPFYLMERLYGHVSETSDLPALAAEERGAVFNDAARVLAAIHTVDWQAADLSDYGKTQDYYPRQVRRWARQWETAKAAGMEAQFSNRIDRLAAWFAENIPAESPTTLVHGDYRIGNVMYATGPARIEAVLDWELSTLGDPLSDLAHWMMFYDLTPEQMGGLAGLDLAALGIPDGAAFMDHYRASGGCDAPLTRFHRAFAMYRMSVILAGITARAKAGQAAHDDAVAVGAMAPQFALIAERLLSSDKAHQAVG
ncbi:phosphotransferase family protein [Neptunicoccus sediminis]|uniref:phosphotransferase family protein n=1 Tax=Neptunicoccus sediminis TaxID=1892596 RepID=UPI000845EE78|nr:phosphotransferase family protein [Neptunicoccus sediminis]